MRYISCKNNCIHLDLAKLNEYSYDSIAIMIGDEIFYQGEIIEALSIPNGKYSIEEIIKLYLIVNNERYYLAKTNFSFPKWRYTEDSYYNVVNEFNRMMERY